MFDRWRYKMAQFMQGRYGMDRFNQFLATLVFIFVILDLFIRWWPLWFISLFLLIYMYFRMFSRNIAKRYNENRRYMEITAKIRNSHFGYKMMQFFRNLGRNISNFFRNLSDRIGRARRDSRQAKQESAAGYRIFKCPQCGQKIRVPKGKGHIMIRCPKCGNQFEKRT